MSQNAVRTQIYLPPDLRAEIEKYRRISGESLAEYLRTAAKERLKKEKRKKEDLKKLADEFVAFVKLNKGKSGWKDVDAVAWQREIRGESEERLKREWNTRKEK